MSARIFCIAVLLALSCSPAARAHEVRPAYLEITETAPETYAIAWKQPAAGEVRIALSPVFPAACRTFDAPTVTSQPSASLTRWRMRCAGGLNNKPVRIAGLERTLTSTIVRVTWADGRTRSDVINANAPTLTLSVAPRPGLPGYLALGIGHILTGFDHVLFVIGLIVIAAGWLRLLRAITAFTVAHSITLSASALGIVSLPQKSVEATIALSIAVVGYEIVRMARGKTGLTHHAPWIVAFGFGLLHGFGFASALAEIGLPQNARIGALLLFNVGVECGQLAILAIVLPPVLWIRGRSPAIRSPLELSIGYAVGIAGAFWMIERIAEIMSF